MSRSWALTNQTGEDQFEVGKMDLTWQDGRPVELTAPFSVLAQRIAKATIEPSGSNPFESRWGSRLQQLRGRKIVGESTLRDIGSELIAALKGLIALDAEASARIGLDPAEQIVGIGAVQIVTDVSAVTVRTTVRTKAGLQDIGVKIP